VLSVIVYTTRPNKIIILLHILEPTGMALYRVLYVCLGMCRGIAHILNTLIACIL
jgi:hypothetical protein